MSKITKLSKIDNVAPRILKTLFSGHS